MANAAGVTHCMTAEERRVIFASSLGTVFEWYDFYLYGSLAAIISVQFFSGVNPTAAFIFALRRCEKRARETRHSLRQRRASRR
ncbi:MAG: hypothetical protein H5U13_12640 [Parvibaculum sp.]|nr:hypothetical protein [Parvibaculum sp.]